MEESTFDPNRRLCPDGSCVGVLGADGLCSVCGHPEGAARDADPPERAAGEAVGGAQVDAGGGAGFDSRRRLCDDGSCVGVVGADGVCGVCGRKAE
jgi:hypothetical protein